MFKTAPYRPVIFTAKDDNAAGEVISGSTGNPSGYYANPALSLANAGYQQFGDFRVAYAATALSAPGTTLRLTDVQLLNCNAGLMLSGAAVSLNNLLSGNVRTNLLLGTGGTVRLEQATLNNAFALVSPTNGLPTGTTLALTNCALASVTNAPGGIAAGYNGFYRTALFGAVTTTNFSYPFQTIGAGAYYLTNGCLWHNAGTTNEDGLLLAALANKTTYPPVPANQVHFGTATNLTPQAIRDNAGNPDCGYHYDPVDYLLGGCDLYTNLTLAAGTAVAWYETSGGVAASGQPYGLSLNNGASFTSLGTATAPCWFTRYNTVQEGLLGSRGWMGGLMPNGSGSAPLPQISALFTKFSTVPGMGSFLRDNSAAGVGGFTHCELYFGFADYSPSYYFTNCLFFRAGLGISPPGTAAGFTFQNCTFWQGTLQPSRSAGQTQSQWTILNTTFDGTTIAMSDGLGANPSNTHLDYNAFLSGANRLEILGPHDVIVSGAYNWQSSWLGNYYLPPDSPLLAVGSTTADRLGLYEFTTQTSQVEEGDAQVDIGYHYVAINPGTGQPYDTLTNGIADYLIDANGDGLPDWWEAYWFGPNYSLSANLLDSQGNTLLMDYQNETDPNAIQFMGLEVTNNYVNIRSVPAQLNIAYGYPAWLAISVDDPNYATDASWQSYTGTNILIPLTGIEGWHQIWVGVKGPAPQATVTWQWKELKLDLTPPQLTITNPVVSTVSVPLIQLQGFCPEPLEQISYDLNNALGLVTNLPAGVTSQYYDTNGFRFTTNYFACVDVPLTNGVNTITLHATDLAGNETTASYSYTLDYSSRVNPPVVNLFWPQNNTLVCNTSYTLRGWVDDPTAVVTLQMTDSGGNTGVYNGLVERDGDFWVEDIPLTNGPEQLTLTVTDSAGKVQVMNLTVNPGEVGLTIDMPDASQLWNQGITVTGTITDPADYTVWVNGALATYADDDSGDWTATNVFLPTGGTALIQARAIPNSNHGGYGTGGSGAAR